MAKVDFQEVMDLTGGPVIIDPATSKFKFNYYDVGNGLKNGEFTNNSYVLSASGIKKHIECPAKYKASQDMIFKQTPSMLEGQLLHTFVLEPEKVIREFRKAQFNGTTVDGKAEKKQALADGVKLIKADVWDETVIMAKNILNDPYARLFLDRTDPSIKRYNEREYYFQLNANGMLIPCKAKMDANVFRLDGKGDPYEHFIIDIKTTAKKMSSEQLIKTILDYGYDLQAWWYLNASKQLDEISAQEFIFIFVETTAPYLVSTVFLNSKFLMDAEIDCKNVLSGFAKNLETGIFEGYREGITQLVKPEYMRPRTERKSQEIFFMEEDDDEDDDMSYGHAM